MERTLNELVERLKKAHGDGLVSVVLYGSGAAGDHHGRFSDLNVFCVLKQITPRELKESETVFRWWRAKGNPAPLLMGEVEVGNSTDCFPIEFHDIQARHKILFGADLVTGLKIDYVFHRAQVEHELRAKLLRLRQKAAGVLSDKQMLLRLMMDSISTFATLFRHALLLSGVEAKWHKRDVIAAAAERFGLDPAPFATLLDLREEKLKPRDTEPVSLFESYLKQVGVVIDAVDRLER